MSSSPEIRLASQDANFARGRFEDLQIDFLLTRNPLFERVRRQYATTQPFRERDIVCATVEGLLLLKLYALPSLYRQANFARVGIYENDVATLVQAYHPDLEPLFAELSRHLSASDLASVRLGRLLRIPKSAPSSGAVILIAGGPVWMIRSVMLPYWLYCPSTAIW